jgi:hypothetical protein
MLHLAGIELTGTSRCARVKNAKSHPRRYVTERIAGSARVELWAGAMTPEGRRPAIAISSARPSPAGGGYS